MTSLLNAPPPPPMLFLLVVVYFCLFVGRIGNDVFSFLHFLLLNLHGNVISTRSIPIVSPLQNTPTAYNAFLLVVAYYLL
jgi:hypothetical protein